jgi:hypothetical protein
VILAVAGAAAVAGCDAGPAPSPTAPAPASPPAGPDASTGLASAPPDEPTLSPPPGAPTVDPALLAILPADIDGMAMTPDEETAAQIAADPTTDPVIERLDVGVYVDTADEVDTDLAVVSVVALEPGAFDDAWFRSWRDTYDEAACEVAGGRSAASAETTIDDRQVFIGTCEGGVHTYHVHLPDPDRIVAVTAVGPDRFGERVVAGLTE